MLSYDQLKQNEDVKEYIKKADEALLARGYTEHSFAHVCKVADTVEYILRTLEYSERDIELAQISAYLHDIGNIVNRENHAHTGAILAFSILEKFGMSARDIANVVSAIGNHDERTGIAIDAVSAALILADKSDVRRTRVRNADIATFDIHDRVNYSVTKSELIVDNNKNIVTLHLTIETQYCPIMDYFEIFIERMIMCRDAAEKLGLKFSLIINGQTIL
jgi:HD superfamily phosphodiesterase